MANVFFKLGKQASYNALKDNRDAGTFYVTSDTNRLYLGDNLLSQAVQVVDTLPTFTSGEIAEGTIYYLRKSNILAIYNFDKDDSTKTGWVQLNPDTYVNEVTQIAETISSGAKITTTVKEKQGSSDKTHTADITITGSNGNVVTSSGTNVINIAAPELTVAANATTDPTGAKITLDDNNVEIIGGENTTVTFADSKIKIDSKYTNNTITGGNIVVEYSDSKYGYSVGASLTDSVKDNPISISAATLNPLIKIATKKDTDGTLTYDSGTGFIGNSASLNVYNTDAVDSLIQEKLNEINGMTYKGTLTPTDGKVTLPTSNVKVGDTYMLASKALVGDGKETYQAGTIFIATGDETDGVITSNLKFDSILTSDSDTNFTFKKIETNKLALVSSISGESAGTRGSLEFAQGTDKLITIDTTSTNENLNSKVTLSHAAVTVTPITADAETQTKGTNQKVTAITAIETDGYGHINKVTTKDVTLIDTVTKLDSNTITVESQTVTGKTAAKVTSSIKTTQDSAAKEANFSLQSESLTVTAASASKVIGVELVWGTFDE